MGSFKVKRLNLKQCIIETFERQNLRTCKDVLCLTVLELQSLLGVCRKEALRIQGVVSEKCVSHPATVYDLWVNREKSFFFPTSLNSLDALLQGGLLLGSVTELCGPPGVGKTQFCFLLSLLAGNVIYIDTESAFSAHRLQKMALKRCPDLYSSERDLLQRISVYRASTVQHLKEIVPALEREVIRRKVGLVIVDSMASLFRKEYSASSVHQRNEILVELAALLKDIAHTHHIVVFVTNQVMSDSADYDTLLPAEEEEDGAEPLLGESSCGPVSKRARRGSTVPALGVTWSHCVNTRLVARFLGLRVCQLTVAKSPVAPNAAIQYTLNEAGCVEINDGDEMECSDICLTDHPNIFTKNHFLTEEITGPGVV